MDVFFEQVSYFYEGADNRKIKALKEVTLSVPSNRFVAVIGETGSGKSTLIQHLNGMLLAKEGSVTIGEIELPSQKNKLSKLRKDVGFLFQYPEHQLFEETVEKEIGYGPRAFGLPEEEVTQRVEAAMDAVALSKELKDRSPFHLSGGQQRRTAIASVLAQKPKMLVLDEPGAGLHPASKEELLQLFYEYYKKQQVTVWMVTHSMEDVVKYADYCVVMHKGKVFIADVPEVVFTNPVLLQETAIELPQPMRFAQKLLRDRDVPFLKRTDDLAYWIANEYIGKHDE